MRDKEGNTINHCFNLSRLLCNFFFIFRDSSNLLSLVNFLYFLHLFLSLTLLLQYLFIYLLFPIFFTAKSWLHSLEQPARCIGLYVNSDKRIFTCFNQDGAISLNAMPLKLVDRCIYLGSNISSIESDVNIRITKAWIAIDWLSILQTKSKFTKL